jgi:hypothetical protein
MSWPILNFTFFQAGDKPPCPQYLVHVSGEATLFYTWD